MSLLPTTRINSLVNVSTGGNPEPGIIIPGVQDEDILLVDFQPVVVPNSQILSSPSTTTSPAMYPLPPPVAQLPGSHMVGMNHHHPSVSSDGVTTPISATGSSGKATNPNNYSLVNLSNHVHHNNNTSREGSDFNYPGNQLHRPLQLSGTAPNVNVPLGGDEDDEDDEYARHQALAQPSYMANKRRSRRFNTRDNHNHVWDNANHVGFHQPQPHMSSSLSSSEDSDTGFLMGTRKTAYTRRSVQKVVDPHPLNTVGGGGGNASPSATTGLLPNLGNRKRVRRRRPSARNRKPANNQRDKIPNPSDVLSFCCCLCQDDPQRRSSSASSIRNRYLKLTCFLIVIIVVAVLTSITLSLQRKVDSIDLSLKKLDQAVGSPLSTDSANGANGNSQKPIESLGSLISAHNVLNSTVVNFKAQLDQILNKMQDLSTKINEAANKPDGVAEVKGALAKLGSRVEELSATIENVQGSIEKLKTQSQSPTSNAETGPDGSVAGGGEPPPPPQSTKSI